MILGIGTDIIEIKRVAEVYRRFGKRFLARLYTPSEQDYCLQHTDPAPSLAARFAAKEAVAKALGTGLGAEINWRDIEIGHSDKGQPQIWLSSGVQGKFKGSHVLITLSHCREYATATAVWIKKETQNV